jgi:ferredoxin-thioredoxin reductase catalytic chain
VGRPLCPCNFYPDPKAEAKLRRWICACEEMQKYKYCHCLLFVTKEGVPITEHLPEDHEGRQAYGVVKDPEPTKGRAVARVLEKQDQEKEG